MKQTIIHDRGRGPEIEGTRITVYDVMDYHLDGWPAARIASWLAQRTPDIQAAIDYIEAHRSEVDEEYRKILERSERGNPPDLQALIESRQPAVEAKKAEILKLARQARANGKKSNGSSK